MRSGVCLLAAISWLSWISSLSAGGDLDAAADRSAIEVKNPLADPTLFPIAAWLQDPNQAGKYIRDQGSCPPDDHCTGGSRSVSLPVGFGLNKGPGQPALELLRFLSCPFVKSPTRLDAEVALCHLP